MINPDSARIELEHFNALRDSLYSTATADALARYKTEFDTDRLREEVEQIHSARHRDIVVGVCVLAVVVLAAVAIHRRRMRRYRAEMLALIRDVESLYGTPEPEKAPTEAAENSFERMVVDVVRQGLASGEDISVSAIASRLNLGEQTFRRRFVAETGKQPKTFVTAIQMEMAARCLRQTRRCLLPGWLAHAALTMPARSPTHSRRHIPARPHSFVRNVPEHAFFKG